MAQYVPYIPEVFPETPLFTPDMNFFDRMMQRKQSMFDQGLNKARSAYSSVLNAPLSVKENIPLRDQYVKDAKGSLQLLASADLSLPQNVAAAESIFSPFWQDKFIMKDMDLSKSYQMGFQTLDTHRNSSDPKVREQYSGIAEKYLMNGYEALQNATRTDEGFSKLERRKFVPFANIQSYLEDQAAKAPDKLEIKWDKLSPDGAYLIRSSNGERVKESFASWAQSQVGNNFYQQFNVTGIVETEERLKIIKQQFPGISDQEANTKLADGAIQELSEGYAKRTSNLDVKEAEINATLKALPVVLTSDQQQQVLAFQDQLATIAGKRAALNEDYKNFNQSKDVRRESVVQSPSNYFATLAKQRVIDGWASGRASIQSTKIETNEAYFKAQDLFMKQKEYERNITKDAWDQKVDQWNMANGNKAGKNTKTNPKEKENELVTDPTLNEGYDPLSRGVYKGLGTTDITKSGTAYDNYTQKMNTLFTGAHNRIFNSQGVMSIMKGLGATDEDVVEMSSALQKDIQSLNNPDGPGYKYTAKEGVAANKLGKLLLENPSVKAAGITKITGPYSLRNAVMAYAKDYFTEKNKLWKEGTLLPTSEESNAMIGYATAIQELELYEANEKKRQELIKTHILSNEKTYAPIIVTKDDKKELLTSSDIEKELNTAKIKLIAPRSISSNPDRELTNAQYAEAMLAGKVSNPTLARMGKDDFEYRVTVNGEDYAILGNYNYVKNKFNDPTKLASLYKQVQQNITPDLLYYSSQTGKMGVEFTHAFDKKRGFAEDKNARIFSAALSTGNAEFYDKSGKPLSADMIDKLQALLADEARIEKYVGQFSYKSQGIGGKPTIEFSVADEPSESGKTGVDVSAIKSQTFNLAILPTATSPDLKDLPTNSGAYVYDKLLRGQKVELDPVISASGFSGYLLPLDNTNPDQVKVALKYDVRVNEKQPNGEIVSKLITKDIEETFNLKGSNAKNPDELMSYVYSLYFKNLQQNKQTQDDYLRMQQSTTGTPGSTTVSKESFFREKGITIK